MIEGANVTERDDPIFKLVALPRTNIDAILLARGHDPDSVDAAVEALVAVGIPFDAVGAIEYSFRPQFPPPPFLVGRFGDGTYPVFYSALESETCVEEVRYHKRIGYYTLLKCDFSGRSMMLVGREGDYPNLVSQTDAGYPFCQAVARWAQGLNAQALFSTSARRTEGTCVPVFVRECLSNAESLQRYQFVLKDGQIECEQLSPQ